MRTIQLIQQTENGVGRLLCASLGREHRGGRHRHVGLPQRREVVGSLEAIQPNQPARKVRKENGSELPQISHTALATMEASLVEIAAMLREINSGEEKPAPAPKPRRLRMSKRDLPLVKASATAAEESPFLKVPTFRPEYHRGMIVFTCPACHFPSAVYPRFAGRKTRCSRCFSAIRAPRVRKGSRAVDMEKHIESLIHPERFTGVVTARGGIVGRILKRIPRESMVMKAAGFAIFMAGLGILATQGVGGGEPVLAMAPKESPRAKQGIGIPDIRDDAREFKAEALEVVRNFHKSDDLLGKARYVRDSGGVRRKMEEYYGKNPGKLGRKIVGMRASGLGFYEGAVGEMPTTTVAVEYDDLSSCNFVVEHRTTGGVIEWESSVGFNPRSWTESIAVSSAEEETRAHPFRVLAAADDYYNYGFASADAYMCVRVMDPLTSEILGYAYAERGGAKAAEIEKALRNSRGGAPLTLELEFSPQSARTRQVTIARLIREGWRGDPGDGETLSGSSVVASVQ